MSKLRILCLHGFTSNGSVHKHQVRHITSQFSSDFELLFPDGPHEVNVADSYPPTVAENKAWIDFVAANSSSGHRAWWFAKDPNPAQHFLGGFQGLQKSLDHVSSIIQESGTVHAIWGFSQGACFAGFLTSLLHDKQRGHPLRQHLPKQQGSVRAGVFFSGFKARFPQYESVYEYGIEVPTLHVMGVNDPVVTIERGETLKSVCRDAKVLKHPGGHIIPTSDEDATAIASFLQTALTSKAKESL